MIGVKQRIPKKRVLSVSLSVRDINEQLEFYKELGFQERKRFNTKEGEIIEVGLPGPTLLQLVQDKDARIPPRSMAGLYHFAILLPDRKSLAKTYLRIGESGIPFEGFADHGVSEALYLSDVEGNGVEIYSDKPSEMWERTEDGRIRMVTEPLNIDSLLMELTREERNLAAKDAIPSGTMIGHVHLKVTDLAKSTAFYMNTLSLELKFQTYSAAFL